MTQNPSTSWLDKAKALDRYRWQLLRERHGPVGSALRFVRDAITDCCFGFAARLRLAANVEAEACDFLLLQSAPKVIPLRRKRLLIEGLRRQGHVLHEAALQEHRHILGRRMLKRPPQTVPLRYWGYAAYAEWLVARFDPSILLNDRNGSLYSPFLRLSLTNRDHLLVQLAHATTVENSTRLGMNDYDYYFLFGRSSFEALQARKLRFGESIAVLAGSHMVDRSYDLPPVDASRRVLLVLGVGPDKEKEAGYQRTYDLLRDWAAANPAFVVLVKAHPRSRVPFWRNAATTLKNVRVLPTACSLAEALAQATIVVNIMSNAVIEAALAQRVVFHVNLSDEVDIFQQERFLGPSIRQIDELTERLASLQQDFPAALAQARAFADFHLAHGTDGLQNNLQALQALLRGESLHVSCHLLPPAPLGMRTFPLKTRP